MIVRPSEKTRAWIGIAILCVVMVASAGVLGLIEPTEMRYAEIAREMVRTGDWLTPRLDGIAHFHKPPLAYWAASLSFVTFGASPWSARLPVAFASTLTLLFTAIAARRRFGSLGARADLAVWVLGSCALFAGLGRTLATDPFLAAAVAGYWAFAPSAWALAALGAGFLAKGPVVFVPTVLPILAAAAISRSRRPLAWLGPPPGWIAFAAIGLPWYLVVMARTPGLLSYLVENQLWERYATTVHHRPGPPWYFLGVLAVGALPWTPALIAGIARAVRAPRIEARVLLCWLFVPLLFFSFSGSKLPAYLLPALPAAAVLAALGLESPAAATRWAQGALLAILALLGWALGPRLLARSVLPAGVTLPFAFQFSFALLAFAAVTALLGRAVFTGALFTAAVLACLAGVAPFDDAITSPHGLAAALRRERAPGERVVEVAEFNSSLPFYLDDLVQLHDVPRERQFEAPGEQARMTVTDRDLAAWTRRTGRVWLFGPEASCRLEERETGLPLHLVGRWKNQVLASLTVPDAAGAPAQNPPAPGETRDVVPASKPQKH